MNKKNKSLIKNIGLFTIGSFGSKILSFLLVPLYTAVLTTTEYGSVDLITSTASLLTPILLLSIFDATLRFGMDSNYKKEDVLSTSINVASKRFYCFDYRCFSCLYYANYKNIRCISCVFMCLFFSGCN